jgi:hypothetical protein
MGHQKSRVGFVGIFCAACTSMGLRACLAKTTGNLITKKTIEWGHLWSIDVTCKKGV